MLIITGMPVTYNNARYNCMIAIVNGEIVLIYPKGSLCNDGVYRETRWFNQWMDRWNLVEFEIPLRFGFKQVRKIKLLIIIIMF